MGKLSAHIPVGKLIFDTLSCGGRGNYHSFMPFVLEAIPLENFMEWVVHVSE